MSYSKLVADNEKLVFKFAPPQTERDDAAGGPQKSSPKFPKNLTKFTASVYYYWWEFLRLNADYIDCCKRHGEYGEGETVPGISWNFTVTSAMCAISFLARATKSISVIGGANGVGFSLQSPT